MFPRRAETRDRRRGPAGHDDRVLTTEARAGAAAIAPMLLGVVPFGLVAGATPVAHDLGGGAAVGFSTIVFAGASQLAAIDVLTDGGSALLATLAACTINLRMLLYSAALAPYMAKQSFARRMLAAYVLTDQAFAVSIDRWARPGAGPARMSFYFGACATLWTSWQLSTIAGVLLGSTLPDDVPLDFAVPLAFLVLLVPTLTSRPAFAAAAAGGLGAVATAELGAPRLAVVVGAVAGIAAGALVDWRTGGSDGLAAAGSDGRDADELDADEIDPREHDPRHHDPDGPAA
jgi:predicted branched-subunit amino acid permease